MKRQLEKLINKKQIIAYVFLISVILLCLVSKAKLLPFISFGAEEARVVLETNLEKYINYQLSEQDKGTLVQYHVKARIEHAENQEDFSVESSEITLNLNQIDGKYPFEVSVLDTDSEYDANTGTVVIKASELNEYVVIGYYDTYVEEKPERQLSLNTSAKITLLKDNDITINSDNLLETQVTENIGELTSIARATEDIYNGYIKANIINGTDYETPYKEINQITVSKKEAQEKIEIIENNAFVKMYQNDEGETITEELGNNHNLVYQSTTIEKKEIQKLLGEDFVLEILDVDGNVIASINQETEFEEDGTLTIMYENEPENIIVRTSEVQKEGILYLKSTKKIKGSMVEIENTKIKTTVQIRGLKEEEGEEKQQWENSYETISELKEAKTNIDMDIDTNRWTNVQQNEVTFDISLNASIAKENMLKNPTIRIELPEQVEKVILGDSSLVYGNGLELQAPYVETSENGSLTIVANLMGAQTEYNENTFGLKTDVKIETTIILKKDIEASEAKINLVYSNQFATNGEVETGKIEKEVSIESYEGEKIATVSESNDTLYSTAKTINENVMINANIPAEDLKVEVAPVKGDTSLSNGDTIYEGEYIKYNIKVTNNSNSSIDNIKIVGNIPDGATYGELVAEYFKRKGEYFYNFDSTVSTKEIEIGTLEAGKSFHTFYEVQVKDLEEGLAEKEIISKIQAYVGEQEVSDYELRNVVKPAEVKVFLSAQQDNSKDKWNYEVKITGQQRKAVTLKLKLPKEYNITHYVHDGERIFFEEGQISEDNIVTLSVTVNDKYSIQGIIDYSKIQKNAKDSQVKLTSVANIMTETTIYQSNENRILYGYDDISIQMVSSNEGEEVKYGEEIDYTITVTNIGKCNTDDPSYFSTSFNITNYLPEGIEPISMIYDKWVEEISIIDEEGNEKIVIYEEYEGEIGSFIPTGNFYKREGIAKDISGIITDKNGERQPNIKLQFKLPYQESITIKVKAKAGVVLEKTKVANQVTATGKTIGTKTSNTISHVILPFDYQEVPEIPEIPDIPDKPDTPDTPDIPDTPNESDETYSIAGVAWIDTNEDGERQTEENLLSGIKVMLANSEEAKVIQTTHTDEKGAYRFSSLQEGNYMVIFQYDTNQYTITQYRKSGVNNTLNSDATSKTITLQGQQMKVGVTDIIVLKTSMSNIDIGLVKNKICDLKLDKYITKVTVNTTNGTTYKEYNNSQLAKVEIKAKEIEGATVEVQYKIVITNEGEIPTTVNKVVDYLPNGLSLASNMNSNWTLLGNGEVINTSTSGQKIKPGESIELALIATKKMTSDTTGTFTNKAEIGDMSNSIGIADIDSTPGNKVETEDDFSKADLIISVSTGAIIIYVSIIMITLGVLAILIYLKRKYGLLRIGKSFAFLLVFVTLIFSYSTVFSENEKNSLNDDSWQVVGGYNTEETEYCAYWRVVKNSAGIGWTAEDIFAGGPLGILGNVAKDRQRGAICINHDNYAFSGNFKKTATIPIYDDQSSSGGEDSDFEFYGNDQEEIKWKYSDDQEYMIYGPFKVNLIKGVKYECWAYANRGLLSLDSDYTILNAHFQKIESFENKERRLYFLFES